MHLIAERVIKRLGGPRAVASMLGMSLTAVYKWTYPIEAGGTGGIIPARRQLELMVVAKQRGITLTSEDFFPHIPKKRPKKKSLQSSSERSAHS